MYVGQWPTSHGPVILPYILKTIWWVNVVLEILIQCDTNIELKLCRYVGQWPIFHGAVIMPYVLKSILMDKCHIWNTGSMWCKDLPDKIYVDQWPTFHCPMILSYISETIWWINVVLEILIQCDTLNWNYINVGQWPIFHGPVILPYIFKTIW